MAGTVQLDKPDHQQAIPRLHQVLLVIFLFFSFSTTARFIEATIGPSEIAMGLLMVATLFTRHRLQWHRGALVAWLLFFAALGIGWLTNPMANAATTHNITAYGYSFIVSLFLLAYLMPLSVESIARLVRHYVVFALIILCIGALTFMINDLPMLNALEINLAFPSRFTLWSANPNQLALAMLPLPWIILWLNKKRLFSWHNFGLFFLVMYGCFFIGFLMRSDAIFIAWIFSSMVVVLSNYYFKAGLKAWKFAAITSALLCAFISYKAYTNTATAPAMTDTIKETSTIKATQENAMTDTIKETSTIKATQEKSPIKPAINMSRIPSDSAYGVGLDQNKTSSRLTLWRNAIEFSSDKPFFGYGPGAFSWIDDPAINMEAHNTLLDILTQSGMVGMSIFVYVAWVLFVRAWRERNPIVLALLASIILYSMVHFLIRQPIFWFYLTLCYVMTRPTEKALAPEHNPHQHQRAA